MDGSRLRAIALRDVHSPHRRRPIAPGLRAIEERREVGLELLRVLIRALSVDAPGTVLARTAIGLAQPVHIDVVRQCVQPGASDLPCLFRYSFELG